MWRSIVLTLLILLSSFVRSSVRSEGSGDDIIEDDNDNGDNGDSGDNDNDDDNNNNNMTAI